MIQYMYIAPGQGQTTPWRQNFDVNRKALALCLFVASLKSISLKSDFIQQSDQGLHCLQFPLHLLDAYSKEMPSCSTFRMITISFRVSEILGFLWYMYIAPGQGQTTPWRQNFDVNRKALSLCPFVASF